jgi:hypothetical protein
MKEKKEYEAPQIRDLEELGIQGQMPLGDESCSVGHGGQAHSCVDGAGGGFAHQPCTTGAH